jgi:hypothetical protein
MQDKCYRMLVALAIVTLAMAVLTWSTHVAAQTPLSGTVGCTLMFDYPVADQAPVAGFPVRVVGKGVKVVPPDQRSITCDALGMREPGQYELSIWTRAKVNSDFTDSPPANFVVTLAPKPKPPLNAPVNVRLP